MATPTTNWSPRISVGYEPTTYSPHREPSFFRDLVEQRYRTRRRPAQRLARNDTEIRKSPAVLEQRSYAGEHKIEYQAPAPGQGTPAAAATGRSPTCSGSAPRPGSAQ